MTSISNTSGLKPVRKHEHYDAIIAFAEGHGLEFRAKPEVSKYGSSTEWMPCLAPDFHPSFEYRVKGLRDPQLQAEIERLNIIAKMHEDSD